MPSISENVEFNELCNLLESLRLSQAKTAKRQLLKEFLDICRQQVPITNDYEKEMKDLYAIFLPSANDERQLSMKEKKLVELIAHTLDTRDLGITKTAKPYEICEKLSQEVSARIDPNTKDKLSVREVSKILDDMASAQGEKRRKLCLHLMERCSETELKWIFNIMIRNIESYCGYDRNDFLSALSSEAIESWKATRDLSSLDSTEQSRNRPDFFLGAKFCPMLLARLTKDRVAIDKAVATSLKNGFFMELKYDGEHVLMHRKDNAYKWFTRNGKDYTEHYGDSSSEGLAGRIHKCFKSTLKEAIIDCELMHYDEVNKVFVRHAERAADGVILSYQKPQPGHRIVVVIFDILYFGGFVGGEFYRDNLMKTTLEDRIKIMNARVLKDSSLDNMFIIERREGSTTDDILTFYGEAMSKREEGIAIKAKDSVYRLAQRAKWNGWFKLKDRFDVDLILVGVSEDNSTKGLGFLLAAWDDSDGCNMPHVICTAHSGLQVDVRKKILSDAKLDGEYLSAEDASEDLIPWKKPVYKYFRKNDWLVVEVTSFGLRDRHMVDVVMRKLRPDKNINAIDIASYREIMRYQPAVSNFGNDVDADEISETSSKKVDKYTGKVKKPTKSSVLSDDTVSGPAAKRIHLPVTDHCLAGKSVCVFDGFKAGAKAKYFAILGQFGIQPIATPNSDTALIVAIEPNHLRVRSAVKKGQWNIVSSAWLDRCAESESILKCDDSEIVHRSDDGLEPLIQPLL